MRWLRNTSRGALILAVTLGALHLQALPGRTAGDVVVGQLAPLFQGTDLAGGSHSLDGLLRGGKTTILFFWGLRCAPCLREMAYLDTLYSEYRDEGLEVLGIEADGTGREGILDILEKLKNVEISPSYPVVPDPDHRISSLFAVGEAPQTFILSNEGVVVYEASSFSGEQRLEIESEVTRRIFQETTAPLTPAKPISPGLAAESGATGGRGVTAGFSTENEEFEKYRYFGDFYYHRQEFDKALDAYAKALEIDGRNTYILLKMGEVCVGRRDFTRAREFWERVLAIDPSNEEADHNMRRLIRGDF